MPKLLLTILLSIYVIVGQTGFIYAQQTLINNDKGESYTQGVHISKALKIPGLDDTPHKKNDIHTRFKKKHTRQLLQNPSLGNPGSISEEKTSIRYLNYKSYNLNISVNNIYITNTYPFLIGIIKNIN